MTYIQPSHHKDLLNRIIAGLALFTVLGVFSLVMLYNNIVDLNHNIATAKAQLDSIGAANTTLNAETVAALRVVQSGDLAAADGLVADAHPQYFTNNQQPITSNQSAWPIASQQ
jgi:hypothetical protein